MDSLQQSYTLHDEMLGASRKKQNSLMHKEINNFDRVTSHALGRFKLDMWYEMLKRVIPDSTEVNSLSALQDLVQEEKEKLRENGEDTRNNVVVMYFRDFFRDIGQLRGMKDIFYTRIYSVLFEYYYDVDAIQEISDVAISTEESEKDEVSARSKLKDKKQSQIQKDDKHIMDSVFSPEIVSELANDCIEISGIIGELKRLVFAWGRLLNDAEIDTQLFNSSNDDQFKDYEHFQHFVSVFKYITDILQKSHQAIVLARNWWFKAEKIQNRLSKIPPPSRQVSGKLGNDDAQNAVPDDPVDFNNDDDDLRSDEWVEEKADYSDDFIEDDDIIEDFGDGDFSDDDDIFLTSDPGAILVEKRKTPANNDVIKVDSVAKDNEFEKDVRVENDEDIQESNDVDLNDNDEDLNNSMDVNDDYVDEKNTVNKNRLKANPMKQPRGKLSPIKAEPTKARKEFATENDDGEITAKGKLKILNANIDAHQRELDVQIQELQMLYDRNQRVKSLCEKLEDTIERQISQRKQAQELMTVKKSLEELADQKTTTLAKKKKLAKHLYTINMQLDELLQSGKLREYQNELLKEDLELQLAVSPTLVSYGNHIQDQMKTLELQLEEERDKLARVQSEFDTTARNSKASQRQYGRVKAEHNPATKSLSADAVNKSRESNISRVRKLQKPARHSDGSAGNLRISNESVSSGSVFLNDGDVEEFDDGEFDDGDDVVEELIEIDSGVGEVWAEEIGKPASNLSRTPAPPASRNSKSNAGKKTRGRPTSVRKETQPIPSQKVPKDHVESEPDNDEQPGRRKISTSIKQSDKQTIDKSLSNGSNKNSRVVNNQTGTVTSDGQSGKPDTHTKTVNTEQVQPGVDGIDDEENDQIQTQISKDENDIRTSHGLFDYDYCYPDSGDQENEETDAKDQDANAPIRDPEPETENIDPNPITSPRQTRNQARTRTKIKVAQDKNKELTLEDETDDLTENFGEQEQTSTLQKSQEKPPIAVTTAGRHPKPPNNKATRNRTRTRAAPIKATSTSDEDAEAHQPGTNNKRESRSESKNAFKEKRSQSKRREASVAQRDLSLDTENGDNNQQGSEGKQTKSETNEKTRENNKKSNHIKKNSKGRKQISEAKEAKKDSRPTWKSSWKK